MKSHEDPSWAYKDVVMMSIEENQGLSSSIWSRLPIEVLREITLYLGSTSLRAACDLRLVSRHFNVWVLPLLFRVVSFTTPDQVTRFAATLLPKRKLHIPAVKSTLHTLPRPLSSYSVESLALVVRTRLPSIEVSLGSVAPVFSRIKNLVITAPNLSSNAHWLRQHPIRPKRIMIVHFGFPHLFNYQEPVLASVTHLYTSSLIGIRGTSVTDLPQLTHLAIQTRVDLPAITVWEVTNQVVQALETLPHLKSFVLVLSHSLVYDPRIEEWKVPLALCMRDKRFNLLPYTRDLYMEWYDMIENRETLWDRAKSWNNAQDADIPLKLDMISPLAYAGRSSDFERQKKAMLEWEIDLVQRTDYSPYEGDPVEKIYTRTRYPK